MALFEVLIPEPAENISVIIPSAAPRGIFWSCNTAVPTTADGQITAKLADNADVEVLGFNGRAVTATGLRTEFDVLANSNEGGFEGPDKVGLECSIWPLPVLMAIEDDTAHTMLSQTNPLTALAQLVNFEAGLARIAQSGERAFYKVVGVEVGVEDATKNRYILKRIPGGTIA